MEFHPYETRPENIGAHLYKQVLDQSELCDVTIKVGHWEMKFHWCVLVTLPFFGSLYHHRFVEKQNGIISMKVSTPLAMKSSLSYLYGITPTITYKSLPDLLEVAEFLMIPNLKAVCVFWMKKETITEDNFYTLLELASIYDFDLPHCSKFIHSNLPVVLHNCNMINLTYESVQDLLSDQTLCYVTMEEKFTFLIKWIKRGEKYKKTFFTALFKLIDIEEMTIEFVEEIVKTEPMIKELDNYISMFNQTETSVVGFIQSKLHWDHKKLSYYDLNKDQLYRLNLLEPNDEFLNQISCNYEMSTNGSKVTIIDYKNRSSRQPNQPIIVSKNLATNKCLKSKIVVEDQKDMFYRDASNVFVYNSANVFISSMTSIKKKSIDGLIWKPLRQTSTMFKGDIRENETKLLPIFSLPDHYIRQICVDKHNILAMLSPKEHTLFLYDYNECQLQILRLETDDNNVITEDDSLTETNDGFVIYNILRVICISRSDKCSMSFKVYSFTFTAEQLNISQRNFAKLKSITFSENYWFCNIGGTAVDKNYSELLLTDHDSFLATETRQSITWQPIYYSDELNSDVRLLVVSLPKNIRKCHWYCPHCESIQTSQYNQRSVSRKTTVMPTMYHIYSHSDNDILDTYNYTERDSSADDANDDNSYNFEDRNAYGYDDQYDYE